VEQLSCGKDKTLAPGPHLFCDPGSLGINTSLRWSSHLTEQPAWPSLAAAWSLLYVTHGYAAGTERWADGMPCQEQVTDYLLPCLSFQLQRSLLCNLEKSACCLVHMWLTETQGSPSLGTMKPQLQSGGSGGPFNNA